MKITKTLFLLFISIISYNQRVLGQNEIDLNTINSHIKNDIKNDIIEFNDGTIKEGKIDLLAIDHTTKNGKVELCDINNNCVKYKRSDINKMIRYPSKKYLEKIKKLLEENPGSKMGKSILSTEYKILYIPKKDNPRICKLIFKGTNYGFYTFSSSSSIGSHDFSNTHIYVNKNDSNLIDLRFMHRSNTKSLEELKSIFKNCEKLESELKKKKKAVNDKSLKEILKIVASCPSN